MFHLNRHHKTKKTHFKHFKNTTELSLVRLIMGLSIAGIETVWSIYMDSFGMQTSTIGYFSAFLVMISLIFSLYSTPILEKFSEANILNLSFFLYAMSFILIYFFNNLYLFLGLAIIITIATVFRMDSFDILFRDQSSRKNLNEDEGLLYSIENIGWLIGPLIAGFIMISYGILSVFLTSTIFIVISFIFFNKIQLKKNKKQREVIDSNVINNLKDYIKNKKLSIPYIMAAGIEGWWALIYIYMPIFIIKGGLGLDSVGIFLALTTIPLVLFEFEIGKLVNKIGFKYFFLVGFFSLSIISILAFMSSDIYLTLLLIILASIPMSFIEPLQDSYFFKQVSSKEEEKYYPIFATAGELGSFISKVIIATVLLFLISTYAYLAMGIIMFIYGLFALKIKE